MKTITKIASVVLLAASFSALACDVRVLGESLDSGLGELGPKYTAQEFNPKVLGESLDNGLGELGPKYTAAEFVFTPVRGESLDDGLGQISREEVMKYVRGSTLRTSAAR